MKVLNVLYQTDDNYAAIAGVSMTSLFETNKHLDEINIYLLNNDISKENLDKYENLCAKYNRNLKVIDITNCLERIKSYGVGTFRDVYTIYLTMFIMDELELNTDRIFKIDADTIITAPLDEICDFDFKGNYIAATYDCTINEYKTMVGLTVDDRYYNAGIILFNQKAWIENNCQQQLIDHIREGRNKYWLCEQDLMNVVFKGNISYLPVRYNLNSGFYIFGAEYSYKLYKLDEYSFSSLEEVKEAMENPAIHHLMGAMTGRPWEEKNNHPLNDKFNEILKESLWSDFKPVVPNRSVIFKIQKILYKILQEWAYLKIHQKTNFKYLNDNNKETLKTASVNNPDWLQTKYYGKDYKINEPLNILYQSNDYYAPYLGVSLLSLLDNNKHIKEINVYIIDDGISKENREKIKEVADKFDRKVFYIDTSVSQKILEDASAPKFRGNYATYFKLFVLDELPENVKTILYVDSDTIVRGKLDEIVSFDFGECSLAMVPAIYHDKYRAKVGISHEDTTYNAGIMAFKLDSWRKNNCRQRLIEGMQNDPQVLSFAPDQSLAIKVLQKDLAALPLKFNFSTLYTLFTYKEITTLFSCHEAKIFDQEMIDAAYKDIAIYHFIELQVGKPWEKDSVHPKKFLWKYYFDKSPWRDLPAPKVKLTLILKLQRIAYKIMPTKLYMEAYKFAWNHFMK